MKIKPIHDGEVQKEILKWLDAGVIPIADSEWLVIFM